MLFERLIISNPYKDVSREIIILFISKIVNTLGAFVNPLLTLILVQRIGMSVSDAGKLITLSACLQAVCILFGGKIADLFKRKNVVIICQLTGAILIFSCGFIKPSIHMAFVIIISSCFYSLANPSYDAMNAQLTNPSNRRVSYSLLYMGTNIGFAIGPIIGGLLYKNFLHIVFIGDSVSTLVSLSLLVFFVKVKDHRKMVQDKEKHIEFDKKDMKIPIWKVLISRPVLIKLPLALFLYQLTYSQFGFAIPIVLGRLFGEDGARIFGFLGSLNGITVIIFTPILTIFTRRRSTLNIMSFGGILYALCFSLILLNKAIFIFFVGIFILTIGEVLEFINCSAFMANNTPESHRGRVCSIIPLVFNLGNAVGPFMMGGIIDGVGIDTGWVIISIISVIGVVIMISCKKYKNVAEA